MLCPLAAHADDPNGGLAQAPLVEPRGRPQGLVFLFSDEQGPDEALMAAARRISGLDVLVAVVDLRDYLRRVRATKDADCLYLVSEIEGVSQEIQARFGKKRYFSPILAGTGLGGAVALFALSQAPAATVAGAASDGFATRIPTARPLCPGAPATKVGEANEYGAYKDWPGFVRLAPRPDQMAAARQFVADSGLPADSIVLTDPDASLAERMTALLEAPIKAQQGARSPLGDLPVVELPTTQPGRFMAVVVSGDGGWRDLDKTIADILQKDGVPVVGLDSLRYFWSRKPPEQLALDLGRIINHYRKLWNRPDVLLIGYSFGADVLPYAVTRLPPDIRSAVTQISLLGLSHWADFEIHVTGWVSDGPFPDSKPTVPELARLDLGRVQCFYGEEEGDDTACPDPALKGMERIKTQGGHHFDGDYEALARAILVGAKRRA